MSEDVREMIAEEQGVDLCEGYGVSKKLIFSSEKWLEWAGEEGLSEDLMTHECCEWVEAHDGKTADEMKTLGFSINPKWMVEAYK